VQCSAFSLLTQFGAARWLLAVDIFALLTAALTHDIDHPGVSNAFLIATSHSLSLVYNDVAVLEQHHASTLFRVVLSKPECNILAGLDATQRRICRQRISSCILGTDLARHFEWMTKLQTRLEAAVAFAAVQEEDRADLCIYILKAADISNVAKPWPIALRWANALVAEFILQGEQERAHGLAVSPHCDRTKTDAARSTIGFIDAIAGRTFELMSRLLSPHGEQLVANVAKNRFEFSQLVVKATKPKG